MRRVYSEDGTTVLLEKIRRNLQYYPAAFLFIFTNFIYETNPNVMLLRLRRSMIDADRLSLIKSFAENNDDAKIYLAVWSRRIYETTSAPYREIINEYDVEVVPVHGLRFVLALSESSVINFCHETDFSSYRRIDFSDAKRYIFTYHGIKVKGRIPSASGKGLPIVPKPRVDLRPVSGDLELYARSALEKRDVRDYDKCGYPRFDRIYKLKEGTRAALPEETRNILDSSSNFKALYAPTQKTDAKLYNLPDFETAELDDFLTTAGIDLYLRMHTNEEGHLANELVKTNNVYYAGRSFSGSSIEILPYMDALITDFSSIFMEFLPFDRPIIFIEDEEFVDRNGIPYDYTLYYPGKKIKSYEQLRSHLEQCADSGDSYAENREFVRKSFKIDSDPRFKSLIQP